MKSPATLKPTAVERRAAALRENLHRRKQQSRAREAEAGSETPPLPVTPDSNEKYDG
ncbi:MAG: hypothetical protein ORO03_11670 [Alphaproteobacteria bacterium]|nr:hypothetical protein [Alphaproteobacteria bacterium]